MIPWCRKLNNGLEARCMLCENSETWLWLIASLSWRYKLMSGCSYRGSPTEYACRLDSQCGKFNLAISQVFAASPRPITFGQVFCLTKSSRVVDSVHTRTPAPHRHLLIVSLPDGRLSMPHKDVDCNQVLFRYPMVSV